MKWALTYDYYDPEQEALRETLCTLGNGYVAARGASLESSADGVHYPGTYLSGGYSRLTTRLSGRDIENEDLVNLPNWLPLSFRIGRGAWFSLDKVKILSYRQTLDMKGGVLRRKVRFMDRVGRRCVVRERRFVSMANPHLAAVELTVSAENWSGKIEFRSALDGNVVNAGVKRYLGLNKKHLKPLEVYAFDEDCLYLKVRTVQSDLRVAEAARTRAFRGGKPLPAPWRTVTDHGCIARHLKTEISKGQTVRVEKTVALFTSRDSGISEPGLEARTALGRAGAFSNLLKSHVLAWSELWEQFDIGIELNGGRKTVRTQRILRLHVFHLLQTCSHNSIGLDVGVPARGLHGEAYRGHIFWDELFIFPVLNLRMPEITRSLLTYRFRRLGEARANALEAGLRGAMYPWQSGSNGREESQQLHLNPKSGRWVPDSSRLQRHVSLAIAYNISQYYEATGDLEFMCFSGSEMLFEIARFWASCASYNTRKGRYEILGVMGPDEYHDSYPDAEGPGVDNNAYTNVVVSWLMDYALKTLDRLPGEQITALRRKLALTDEELKHWNDISRKIYVPFHDDGIISQFEGYEKLEEFDWEAYREKYWDIHRLDRILENEGDTSNRYKLSKQADVLMLFYLFTSEQLAEIFKRLRYPFEYETIPKNIEYYERRTSHGSTLSRVVHSWVLARLDRPGSWKLFTEALASDVADIQNGTTSEGIHLGAMAGTVDLAERAYGGLVVHDDALWIQPCLPEDLTSLKMSIRYRGHALEVLINHEMVQVSLHRTGAGPMKIGVDGKTYEMRTGETKEFPI